MKNPFRKTIKKGELVDLDVEFVSLLFDEMKPKNGKGTVVKGAGGQTFTPVMSSAKFKSDKKAGKLYVTLMEPGLTLDPDGDRMTEPEVEKAMYKLSQKGLIGRIDTNHNFIKDGDYFIAEHHVLKALDEDHFPGIKIGAGVEVIQCTDLESESWKKVLKGDFNGVSIYGKALDVPIDNSVAVEALKATLTTLENIVVKGGNDDLKAEIKKIENKIKELEGTDDNSIVTEAMKGIQKSIDKLLESLPKAISKSINEDPEGDDVKNEKKIKVQGEEIVIKDYHREIIEKGFASDGDPEKVNLLVGNTSDQFIDETIDNIDDETLNEISVAEMDKDNKVDVGIVEDLILKNELDGDPAAQTIAASDLEIAPGILKGEMKLSRTTVEHYKQKYGEEAYLAYVLLKLGRKALKAVKHLLFKGDRASGTAKLKGLDGVLKLATTAVDVTTINTTTYQTWVSRFEQALLEFTDDMLSEQENFKIYVSFKDLIRVKGEAKNPNTLIAGRLMIDGSGKVSFDGIPVKGRFITDNYIIAGHSKFIIIGVRTDAEVYRRFIPWFWHWYIRLRAGITYVTGFIKVYKLEAGS